MTLLTIGGPRDRNTIQLALVQLVETFDTAKRQADALAQAMAGVTAADLVALWVNTSSDEAAAILGAIAAFEAMVAAADQTAVGPVAASIRDVTR